jgi:hypothetical protein
MPSKKIQKHTGQRQLPGVTEYEEVSEDRPKGMPTLAMIKIETARLGLPDSDAEHLYDIWLRDDFRTKHGSKVRSWTAAIRIWFRNGYFPSLKKTKPKPGELMTNEILDALAANPAYKKLDVQAEGWAFAKWCKQNDRQPLVTSFIKSLNAKL